jgi:spermidine synthase
LRWTREGGRLAEADAKSWQAETASPGTAREAPRAGLQPAGRRRLDTLVPVLFLASGAAGLIYQVVWTQDLVLVFGDTTQAVVTTVTAFLAGLGIGALVGSALGARLRRALAVYGLLEIAVGCLALLMPLAFEVVATLFRSAYLTLPSLEVALIRFALAFVALTPVTLLMGMSLPVLTKHLVRTNPDVGERIARLYGLNALGAVLGSVISGYVLIELLGLLGTTNVAVALNLCAGGGAVLISRTLSRAAGNRSAGEQSAPVAKEQRPALRSRQRLLLGVTLVSGFVSLALEVLWTRVMLQDTGSSIYVFVTVVAVFLIGIASGSLVYERRKDQTPQLGTLGTLYAIAGALATVPLVVSNLHGPAGLPFAALAIFPVTAILGYAFPMTVRLFVDSAELASRGVGLVYAVNTAGCVAGTVTAGFVLIPTIGTNAAVIAVCLLQAAVGTALATKFSARRAKRPYVALAMVALLLVMLALPAARLTYIQRTVAAMHEQTAHFEDPVASVDVVGGKPTARNLLINGEGITQLTIDTKLLAYIPKAARPNASTMLTICFGMGSTFRSSIILGMHTTAVELDPTVPTVMDWFYADAQRYLRSKLAKVIISDGRNYVRLSDARYDLITIDPPPPIWSAGAVVLMTQEFYQEARQRLAPGGVLTSFLGYGDTKLLLRTFRSEFRYVTVIKGPRPYGLYAMGSQSPIDITTANILKVFGTNQARADLGGAPDWPPTPTADWPSIIHKLTWLVNNQVNRYVGAGPLLTDDHPLTEYFFLSDLGTIGGNTPRFERTALQAGIAVTGLLLLLIIGITADAVSRRSQRFILRLRHEAAGNP